MHVFRQRRVAKSTSLTNTLCFQHEKGRIHLSTYRPSTWIDANARRQSDHPWMICRSHLYAVPGVIDQHGKVEGERENPCVEHPKRPRRATKTSGHRYPWHAGPACAWSQASLYQAGIPSVEKKFTRSNGNETSTMWKRIVAHASNEWGRSRTYRLRRRVVLRPLEEKYRQEKKIKDPWQHEQSTSSSIDYNKMLWCFLNNNEDYKKVLLAPDTSAFSIKNNLKKSWF
jgi:hypothetical protein